jgi:hypothetical protein
MSVIKYALSIATLLMCIILEVDISSMNKHGFAIIITVIVLMILSYASEFALVYIVAQYEKRNVGTFEIDHDDTQSPNVVINDTHYIGSQSDETIIHTDDSTSFN